MTRVVHYLKTIVPLVIFFIIAFFLWQGLKQDPSRVPSPLINKPLPSFSAVDLFDSHQVISNNLFTGHVSVLNVFATWCLSCQVEHPILIDLHKKQKVFLYGLNYKDTRNKTLEWLKQRGNPYDRIINDTNGQLGINLGVYGTPETFIIDQAGVVRYKHIGPINKIVWKTELDPIIDHLLQVASK